MRESTHPIARLLREDRRYTLDAYVFIFEALQYAQNVLRMGAETPSEPQDNPPAETKAKKPQRQFDEEEDTSGRGDAEDFSIEEIEETEEPQRHVSGQQLCEAIRRYALEQYGYMAKTVLNNWGLHNTGDFGEIVFNLIRVNQMRKTPSDSRVDFENIYDFESAFKEGFKIALPGDEV